MLGKAKILVILPIAMGLAAPAIGGGADNVKLNERQQKKLDARLADRTKGEPKSCISRLERRNMTVVSDEVIIFGKSRNAKTIYVNKPRGGCHGAEHEALVMRSSYSQLCKGEIARVQDLTSGSIQGSCAWNEFVPYTKTES